ncbi:MAG: ArnT family glycosyltransferase [Bacteroidia bacterium]
MTLFQRILSSPWFKALLFITLCMVFIFMHLTSFSLRLWDEARLVKNAIEMNESGNYIVTTFDHQPDFWSAKPPLMIWLQVICLKLFGMSELSFRLPSAFAAVATCLALIWFVVKTDGSFYKGLLAVFILLTSAGYNSHHGIRTGDFDSLLTLFSVLYVMCFYLYLRDTSGRYLLFFFIFLTLAVLCKSIAGVLFLPSLFLFAFLFHRQALMRIPYFWQSYAGFFVFLLFGAGFFLLREHYNPGYLKAVIGNDMIGAVLHSQKEEDVGFLFYVKHFFASRYQEWIYLLLFSFFLGLNLKDKKQKEPFLFLITLVLPALLLLSLKQLKKEWYDLPLYPFFALCICYFIWFLLDRFNNKDFKELFKTETLHMQFCLCLLITVPPGVAMFNKVYIPDFVNHDHPMCDESNYMILALRGQKNIANYKYLDKEYDPDKWFYRELLKKKGILVFPGDTGSLHTGDVVMVRNQEIIRRLCLRYSVVPLDTFQTLYVYKIK